MTFYRTKACPDQNQSLDDDRMYLKDSIGYLTVPLKRDYKVIVVIYRHERLHANTLTKAETVSQIAS